MPSCVPWSTGPGEVQTGPESPNPGEAQVGTTVTRSRVVSGSDKNHQVQVRCRWQTQSPGLGEALVGTSVTRYMTN